MIRNVSIVVAMTILATAVAAQAFNLDIGSITPGAAGGGTPAPTYGAAAQQPGRWNYIAGIDTGPYAMVDLMNNPTGITCTRSEGLGGMFGYNNSLTTGYFQSLMDDAHNTGIAGTVTYTFIGLAPGAYTVLTYAWSPFSATDLTNVTISGSSTPNPQVSGGALQALNTFTLGITHTIHAVTINPGMNLVITCSGVGVAGALNGLQVCDGYGISLTQAAFSMPVVITNFRGSPGNAYANLATLYAGTFPNGPVFGLDMLLADAVNEVLSGPPFLGVLNTNGMATFSVGGLPPGLVVYFVSLELDPVNLGIISVTAPFSYEIL